MKTTLIITNARLSFDKNLLDPAVKIKGDKKLLKYTCNILVLPQTTIRLLGDTTRKSLTRKDLDLAIENVLKDKFGGKVPPKYENWAVRSNSEANNATTGDRYDGYEDDNGFYFSPSTYEKPPGFFRSDLTALDIGKVDHLAEAHRLFYGGCYADFKITLGAYEMKEEGVTKRGVTTYLESLKFVRHGEPFGGGSGNAEGFEAEKPNEDEDPDI